MGPLIESGFLAMLCWWYAGPRTSPGYFSIWMFFRSHDQMSHGSRSHIELQVRADRAGDTVLSGEFRDFA